MRVRTGIWHRDTEQMKQLRVGIYEIDRTDKRTGKTGKSEKSERSGIERKGSG